MAQPEGNEIKGQNMVCNLNKSIYGLKQASHVRNKTSTQFLLRCKMKAIHSDSCVSVSDKNEEMLIMATYVDDGLVAAKNPRQLADLLYNLQSHFDI